MDYKFKRVVVAGAGGVGFWLTWALCRMLAGSGVLVEVWDSDNFEGGNGFRRLPKPSKNSLAKVRLLQTEIGFIMRDPVPNVYEKLLLPRDFEEGDWKSTLVLDCTDMGQRDRNAFWDALEAAGAKGLRISYDGLGMATISPGPPMVGEMGEENDDGGYAVMPHIGQSFLAAGAGACAVMYFLRTGKHLEFQFHVPTPEHESIEIDLPVT